MQLINSEYVAGANMEPYFIRTSGTGANTKISIDWVRAKTGAEESIEVLSDGTQQDIELVLESIRKAIRYE